jgi:hypothetical protein
MILGLRAKRRWIFIDLPRPVAKGGCRYINRVVHSVVEKDAELLNLSTWIASLMFIEKRKKTSLPEAISPFKAISPPRAISLPGAYLAKPSATSI